MLYAMTENRPPRVPEHRKPQSPAPSDREATAEVASFKLESGRWPSPVSADPAEAALGVWLHRQRTQLAQGAMDEFRRVALDADLEGWAITPGEGWLESARNVANFFMAHGRRPVAWAENKQEHQAALWLESQHSLVRAGMMSERRRAWMNKHCPQWNNAQEARP